MERRTFLVAAATSALVACGAAEVRGFPTIAAALATLDALLKTPQRAHSGWPLPAVLEHAAQSVEFSLEGFPEVKSPLFHATVGAAAFALFDAKGSMHHSLTDPIPGAPAVGAASLEQAVARLQTALRDFEMHRGTLAQHFAYGALDHAQYTRAHLMHLANHWEEVVRG